MEVREIENAFDLAYINYRTIMLPKDKRWSVCLHRIRAVEFVLQQIECIQTCRGERECTGGRPRCLPEPAASCPSRTNSLTAGDLWSPELVSEEHLVCRCSNKYWQETCRCCMILFHLNYQCTDSHFLRRVFWVVHLLCCCQNIIRHCPYHAFHARFKVIEMHVGLFPERW